MTPGVFLAHWLVSLLPGDMPGNDLFRFFIPGFLVLAGIMALATFITTRTKGAGRWIWWLLPAGLSGANALFFSMGLRA